MPLDPAVARSAATRADTAIVVIGRAAGEARESTLEEGSYYLTADEERSALQVSDLFLMYLKNKIADYAEAVVDKRIVFCRKAAVQPDAE